MKRSLLNNINNKKSISIINKIKSDGYYLLKNGIKQENVKKLLRITKSLHEDNKKINYKGRPDRDSKDLRVYNLPKKNKLYINLISDLNLEIILKKLLNDKYYRWLPDNLPNYILNSFNARSSGYELDLHIDSVVPFKGNYPISIIVLFVLEKMGSENGATVVVPHSHKSGTYTKRKTNKKKTISAKSGDILFLDTRTWHGTTENKTENSRWLLNAVFSLWSLKQQVDFQNSIPQKILKNCSKKQKQILGFCSIPPKSERDRINIKCGYEIFK